MTKEQEAIDKLTAGEKIDFTTLVRKFKSEGIENFAVVRREYLETVLNILKEKDKEIEKKDKIIDLMVKAMNKIQDPQVCKYCEINLNNGYCVDARKCKEGIKQYFERKSEE